MNEQHLTKKGRYLLKRQQKEGERLSKIRKKKIKKIINIILVVLILGGGIFGLNRFLATRPPVPESVTISKTGIHWHANLSINIFGEPQDIPAGIGLEKLPHKPLHTHDRDGVIHMEFAGLVKKEDIKLGQFFEILGKTFNRDCIFDKCFGEEGQLKMLVNSKENFEFENYVMQDEDKIEIIFEKEVTSSVKEFVVSGNEFSFSPSTITVKAGEKVKIIFENNGRTPHNLVIEGLGISTKVIGGGKTDIIEFIAPTSGTYVILCSVPGHRAAGMEGQLRVEVN